ncbi:hypothetical protein AGABI2DRAFT_68206 [Agaricus bisporus var. bisporus H97]|uniref:hypothetical protein n=1 Tax=Agaricus bisporus var. bisporus (strain H97 / ATCC MYA-4626 / FGSC 10389) TaxID=936046 RepID=UPI00029F69A4|nr:hypothetical protein AGABI2DRAFT_68206 [Agaricus bisporus var. bisporus H97]EKV48459.1 hypothetical protein AGABI2DRAFT_68206 [Agaricus bisporus var. bisporus H97]
MRSIAITLALVASACAYSVSQPSSSMGWSTSGGQPLTWSRVDTDPTNFTVVLTNQDRSVLPQDQVLIAEQDGVGQTKVSCNPPSGGWPVGDHFRVNLVKNVDEQNAILAQSSEFTIKAANTTSSILNISANQP